MLQRIFLCAASGSKGWIGVMTPTSGSTAGLDISVNATGDVYVLGTRTTTSDYKFQFLFKVNKTATLQWQREYGPPFGSISPTKFTFDSSQNIYVNSWNDYYSSTTFNSIIDKYNSSGVFQTSYRYNVSGSYDLYSGDILVDSGGNIYSFHTNSGARNLSYYNDTTIARKHDASFNNVWTQGFDAEPNFPSASGITIARFDPLSGNIIANGRTFDLDTGGTYNSIYKINSSTGALISTKHIVGGSPGGMAVDASGNIYLVTNSFPIFNVMKLNSSYAIQWQRDISASSRRDGTDLCLDQSGNVYVSAYGNDGVAYILKFNNSGSLQWQRSFNTTGTDVATAIAHDGVSSFYITGQTNVSGSYKLFFAKFPDDGTLTGTYALSGVNYVYAVSTLTNGAGTFTSTNLTISSYGQSFNRNSVAFSEAAGTQTLAVKML
jgi:sugar lactone lactonase YvrE